MALDAAHRGYMYQDILSAYFVAHEIALENLDSKFIFDKKKTPQDDMYPFYWTKVKGVFLCAIHLNTKRNVLNCIDKESGLRLQMVLQIQGIFTV